MKYHLRILTAGFSRRFFFAFFLFSILYFLSSPAYADNNAYILRGISRILGAAFQLPMHLLKDTATSFPFGIVTGAVTGTIQTFWGILAGGLDVAKGAAPYAKYLVFL